MKTIVYLNILCLALIGLSCTLAVLSASAETLPRQDQIPSANGPIEIRPIGHASFYLLGKDLVIAVDPVGSLEAYKPLPKSNLILLTDVHQDHVSLEILSALVKSETKIVAPSAVAAMLPEKLKSQTVILTNGQKAVISGLALEAIPMYNTTPERSKYHVKGRGNGYVLELSKKRIYISGDTEDIPEMRALKQIDAAFLCMNLPYTMTVDQAAAAVNQFKPSVVYPYHSRGSDLEKFKKLVNPGNGVEVRLLQWYGK